MEWKCSARRGKHQLHPDWLLAGQLVTVERFPETGSLQGRWGLNNGRASIEVIRHPGREDGSGVRDGG